MRSCELEDLNDFSNAFFARDYSKGVCFDDISPLRVRGNLFSTKPSRTYGFQLSRCEGKESCKSEEEIDDFIRTATVNMLYTSEEFNVNVYGERNDVISSVTVTEYLDLPRKGMKQNT